jgi:hypothetical protein
MSLVLQSTGGGQITLQEPATASNFTQTLPASTGTILTTGSPQSGGVIQVVSASTSTPVTSASSSYVATGLTATITPKFATSRILVLINHANCLKSSANANNYINMRLQKNGSDLQLITSSGGFTGTAMANYFTISYVYLDSPATTSATTYSTTFANPNNMASSSVQSDGVVPSTITLMEIAA